MGFKRFGLLLALRLAVLMLSLAVSGWLLFTPGYHAATALSLAITAALTIEVFRFISRTNRELTRFLEAARYADFGQRFQFDHVGAGFAELGATFTHILERFQADRQQQEQDLRHLRALLEHVPVALLSVRRDGELVQWNNAARRQLGSSQCTRLQDLERFGHDFVTCLQTIEPGQRRLAYFDSGDERERLSVAASEISMAGRVEKLISLQNIQSELDVVELNAWQDLVRVLTHEIMNSITPVASLARTASDLVEDVRGQLGDSPGLVSELDDVHDAVSTVARRSDGLMNFVTRYRQLTRLPAPERQRFSLAELFGDALRMAEGAESLATVETVTHIDPPTLELHADRQLLEQVLINLLKNARQALQETSIPTIELRARLNPRGQVVVEVCDNGPGIPPDVAERIFVPFYTTRREGSGVGLALARQVMTAHGGSINYSDNPGGGARFTLVF